jgi:hypothetical protein
MRNNMHGDIVHVELVPVCATQQQDCDRGAATHHQEMVACCDLKHGVTASGCGAIT